MSRSRYLLPLSTTQLYGMGWGIQVIGGCVPNFEAYNPYEDCIVIPSSLVTMVSRVRR